MMYLKSVETVTHGSHDYGVKGAHYEAHTTGAVVCVTRIPLDAATGQHSVYSDHSNTVIEWGGYTEIDLS